MKIIRWFFAAMLFVVFPTCGYTQDWPTHVIRVIVPFPAGGSGDVQVRIVANELSKAVGQPIIVENKPGGSGTLASLEVARAPADGYTLLVGSVGTHAINASLYKNLKYDPIKDFEPLTLMTIFPQVVVPGMRSDRESVSAARVARWSARAAPLGFGR